MIFTPPTWSELEVCSPLLVSLSLLRLFSFSSHTRAWATWGLDLRICLWYRPRTQWDVHWMKRKGPNLRTIDGPKVLPILFLLFPLKKMISFWISLQNKNKMIRGNSLCRQIHNPLSTILKTTKTQFFPPILCQNSFGSQTRPEVAQVVSYVSVSQPHALELIIDFCYHVNFGLT